ncbi:phasin family protein [Roseomonas gilardii]|uniref:phasin family protein n=1 Tax=Roseomonas gilardii TaxID=257708 RepID=UPI0011A3CEA4|nr:phasin family protein [Roseomonas gilardii]
MATEPKVARLASDTTQNVAAAANEAARQSKAALETGATQARRMMEESMTQATKLAEGIFKSAQEAMDFGRGNVEALTQATQTYVAGTQDLSRQTFALFQSLSDQAMENARAFATVRSVKDAAELQANFARQTLERVMGETAKLQEASFRLAEQAGAPLAQRMTLAMERATKPLNV